MVTQASCILNSKRDRPYKEDDQSQKRARHKNYFERGTRMLPCLKIGDVVRLREAGQ